MEFLQKATVCWWGSTSNQLCGKFTYKTNWSGLGAPSASFASWLPSFYDSVLNTISEEVSWFIIFLLSTRLASLTWYRHAQKSWTQQVFPSEPHILASLLTYVLMTLTESFRRRIEEMLVEEGKHNIYKCHLNVTKFNFWNLTVKFLPHSFCSSKRRSAFWCCCTLKSAHLFVLHHQHICTNSAGKP